MTQAGPLAVAPPTAGLDWACHLLFDSDRVVARRRGQAAPAGFGRAEAYLALPRAANPRLLVPLGSTEGGGHRAGPQPRRHLEEGPPRPGRLRGPACGSGSPSASPTASTSSPTRVSPPPSGPPTSSANTSGRSSAGGTSRWP